MIFSPPFIVSALNLPKRFRGLIRKTRPVLPRRPSSCIVLWSWLTAHERHITTSRLQQTPARGRLLQTRGAALPPCATKSSLVDSNYAYRQVYLTGNGRVRPNSLTGNEAIASRHFGGRPTTSKPMSNTPQHAATGALKFWGASRY